MDAPHWKAANRMTTLAPTIYDNQHSPEIECDAHHDFHKKLFWQNLVNAPYKGDLFSVLRWVECQTQDKPLLGRSPRPHFDSLRLAQEPSLNFAASTISSVLHVPGDAHPRVTIHGFGLFGPNGPLPLHLTEYARERLRRFNDPTFVRFADMFHHRLILLFYRAWADTQSTVSMDRRGEDRFTRYVASLVGYGQPGLRSRDNVADHAKFFHASHLARQTRNPEGLAKILSVYFEVPVVVQEFVPHWITLLASEQTRLSQFNGNNRLGEESVIGTRVLDAQHKIRIRMGPMPLARYCTLLPTGIAATHIATWIKNYLGLEFFVQLQLVLRKDAVFSAQLGNCAQLGWTSWLDAHRNQLDADDLTIECDL
jgi:type VI secretion system protein ImpH